MVKGTFITFNQLVICKDVEYTNELFKVLLRV